MDLHHGIECMDYTLREITPDMTELGKLEVPLLDRILEIICGEI